MLEPGAASSACNHHMLILAQQMLRWLIPHLPIQASTLAAKSEPVVVYYTRYGPGLNVEFSELARSY